MRRINVTIFIFQILWQSQDGATILEEKEQEQEEQEQEQEHSAMYWDVWILLSISAQLKAISTHNYCIQACINKQFLII